MFIVKQCNRFIAKIQKIAPTQREINATGEVAQSIIGHLKYLLNESIKIFERYNKKIIEAQQNVSQEIYGDCIKDDFQYN